MYLGRILKLSVVAAVIVTVIGCSATPTRRSFKETWKDSVVSTKVKMKLTGDNLVKKRNIDVDTWRGVVTLTGRVTSMEEKERAEQLSWMANGVRGVDNYLKLVDDSYFTTETTEMIATNETEIDITNVEELKTTNKGAKLTEKEKIVVKEKTHPVKSKAGSRVTGPVEYQDNVKAKTVAKRTARTYNRPNSSNIVEEDLTTEESLAIEAAEELRRLRGEDVSE